VNIANTIEIINVFKALIFPRECHETCEKPLEVKLLLMNGSPLKLVCACFLSSCILLNSPVVGSEILSCTDSKGNVTFTDDRRNCVSLKSDKNSKVDKVALKNLNTHSIYGETVSEEYRNYSFRSYEEIDGYNIRIIAEKKLVLEDPGTLNSAAKQLEKAVARAISSFPARVRHEFRGVRYYLFTGAESRVGARRGGQWYFRKGNNASARFDDSIVIRSAKDYIERYSAERAAQTAAHELSHAYYRYHRKRIYWSVNKAFKNAKSKKLYTNVKHKNGRTIKKAYAMTNQVEYFAEISKIFIIGGPHFPFNISDLKQYDPVGYKVVKDAYGL